MIANTKRHARRWQVATMVLLVGGVSLAIAIWAAAAGHGSYLPARLLFPYAMLTTSYAASITTLSVILAVVQFPAYALGLALPEDRETVARRALLLGSLHVAAVLVGFWLVPREFFT